MVRNAQLGKKIRLNRIFDHESRRTVIVPIDDSLIFGPTGGLARLGPTIRQIASGKPDAVLAFSGAFRHHPGSFLDVPGILNLTASTVRSAHTRKKRVSKVEWALAMGMDAVAAHVNVTSTFESEMIESLGGIANDCERFGMPLMAIMYPRRESDRGDYNYQDLRDTNRGQFAALVAHAARIGVELGADIVKTVFTGDAESFRAVVQASEPVPVVVAGGPVVDPVRVCENAHAAVKAGAAGVSFGRNVFHRERASDYVLALKRIVHGLEEPRLVAADLGRTSVHNKAP